jgi:sugar phosphate isomerase/epimerase
MNRREFLAASAAAPLAAQQRKARPQLCIFSKHMPQFDWAQLGAKAREMGFDGVDLTVRPKGHVLPERVAEDLPRAVDTLRKHGVQVPMITTDLQDASDPAAKPTFEAMKKCGIQLYKIGYWSYKKEPEVAATIAECRKKFQGLVALSRQYGLTAGLHNHSGADVGCSLWEYREILAGTPDSEAGYYFDPGHATIEGGLFGWRVSLDVAMTRLKMAAIKDFFWEKQNGKWRTRWCPLGEGMVDWPAFFAVFAKAGYAGPISLHLEYPGGEELPAVAKDLEFMKRQAAAAYGA